jgi:hypothetical protein
MLAIVREVAASQIALATLTVALPVAAIWWCIRSMRSSRSSTFDRCSACGATGRRYDEYCPQCRHGTKPSERDGYARLDAAKLREAANSSPVDVRQAKQDETRVELLETPLQLEGIELKRVLLTHGVTAEVVQGKAIGYSKSGNPPRFYHVIVSSGDEARARKLVESLKSK